MSYMISREIQYWCHGQATLFTAHVWIKKDESTSFALISDYLTHDKQSVYVFMNYILKYLRDRSEILKVLNVFSDGAGSQFKQKYLFSNLHAWEREYDIKLKWNFFATSHGKGVVDGIGGTIKRAVWRQVKTGHAHITTAEQYAKVAEERNPNIHVHFIPKTYIEQLESFLEAKWENVLTVPKTHQRHYFAADGSDIMMVADTSDSTEFTVVRIRKVSSETGSDPDEDSEGGNESEDQTESSVATQDAIDLSIGKWVIVNYDGEEFPGEITSNAHDFEINVMHKSGNKYWKWPGVVDRIFYEKNNVVRNINPPRAAGHRGQFVFDKL